MINITIMGNLKVRIKKLHKDAVIPSYARQGDAGLDLTAVGKHFDLEGNAVYQTGLAIEIPEGYVGLLFPRSSICKQDLSLCNSVGIIDSNYRGEILVKFKPTLGYEVIDDSEFEENKFREFDSISNPSDVFGAGLHQCYYIGDRIAQLIIMPYPRIEFEEVEELTKTKRGNVGFGSSGK